MEKYVKICLCPLLVIWFSGCAIKKTGVYFEDKNIQKSLVLNQNFFNIRWNEGLNDFNLNGTFKIKSKDTIVLHRNDAYYFEFLNEQGNNTYKGDVKFEIIEKSEFQNGYFMYQDIVEGIDSIYINSVKVPIKSSFQLKWSDEIIIFQGKRKVRFQYKSTLNGTDNIKIIFNHPNYLIESDTITGYIHKKSVFLIDFLQNEKIKFLKTSS